jgi:hypothetical protein
MRSAISVRLAVCGSLMLFSLTAWSGAQSTTDESVSPRAQEADQKGAAAGEAPPAPVQSARTPADDKDARPPAPRGRQDAAEHLARIEAIVAEALGSTPQTEAPKTEAPAKPDVDATGDDAVGTTGTTMTEESGETVTMERARLEEIRMHLEQIRTALDARTEKRPD